MSSGLLDINSELVRKKWVREGLVQSASKSFWAPYTGNSMDSIVYQENNENAAAGHTVVFDFDGNLSGKAVKGKETASGKGEIKRKFSDKLTVERYRIPVDNGDRFDGKAIGDLSINEHADSRTKLADLFVRWKDQMLFDTAQSFRPTNGTTGPSHVYVKDVSSNKFGYNDLVDIEKALRTGVGFKATGFNTSATSAGQRSPLRPFRLADGRSIWLMIIDPFTAANIKGNTAAGGIAQLAQHADLRGNQNRVFRGLLGQIGQLVIVEAEAFFGENSSKTLEGTSVEIAGLRQFDGSVWSGEAGYTGAVWSRNLILGAGALQIGFGKQPDYKFQVSSDFGINSESALEFWVEAQKTVLKAETSDYKQAKIADLDFACVAVDLKLV